MSKKLVQINVVCNGSTGKIMEQINQTAINDGYEAYSFYGRGNPGKIGEYIRIGNDFDIKLHGILTRVFDRHGHGSKEATRKMIEQIKEINPDIIHMHNIHGYYLNIEVLFDYLKNEYKGKIIWTLHDCWSFTGHCSHFSFVECDKWKEGCYKCPQKNRYPKSMFIDGSRREYRIKKELFTGIDNLTIITPSKWLAALVKQSFLKQYDVQVINNGIDLDIFKQVEVDNNIYTRYNIDKNKKIVLGVANIWDDRKGLNHFVELFKDIDNDIQIILVGLNDNQVKDMPNNIVGIKRTDNQRALVELYNLADVFLNTTMEDTFPTVNIEAMACGTPIIAFDIGGCPEQINEDTGVIITEYNNKKIIDTIKWVINNLKNSEEISKKAEIYDSKDRYKEYLNLYNS